VESSLATPKIDSAKTSRFFFASLLLTLLYTASFFVIASSQFQQHGFPLDDSYIYQTVARGLAHGAPGFALGQHAGGATSFLWVYLQAADYKFFHGIDPVFYNMVLSWLLLLIIGQLLFAISRQDRLPQLSCWILAASPALCGNFLWLGMIGMEHLLFVALSLASIYFWFLRGPDKRRDSAVVAGISLGLLAMTRPEAMAFGPALLLLGFRTAQRKWDEVFLASLAWLGGVVAYFAWSFHNFHSPMPSTLKGRSWLWFQSDGGPHTSKAIAGFFRQWLQRLPRQFSAHFVETQMRLTRGNRMFTLLVLALLIFILIGLYALLSEKPVRIRFLLLLAFLHAALYLVLLPATGHGGRYQPLFLLLLFPLIFSGVEQGVAWIAGTERAAGIAITVLLAAGASSLYTWRSVTMTGCRLINETHGRMAAWIRENLPSQTGIAAFDSGRISYDLPYAIADMGGLTDSSFLPYLTSGRVLDYLQLHRIQYFVLPELEGQQMPLFYALKPQAESTVEFCVSPQLFKNGYAYTSHAWRCQHLYALK
jgi:hypothetical protein